MYAVTASEGGRAGQGVPGYMQRFCQRFYHQWRGDLPFMSRVGLLSLLSRLSVQMLTNCKNHVRDNLERRVTAWCFTRGVLRFGVHTDPKRLEKVAKAAARSILNNERFTMTEVLRVAFVDNVCWRVYW